MSSTWRPSASRRRPRRRTPGRCLVLTARAENYLHGRPDLDDTIARLQAYEQAGADVLYAPGLSDLQDIRRVVESVALPVNVLALANVPPVHELASVGVRRISLGGAFAFAALGAVVAAANELREQGTYGYWQNAKLGAKAARSAFPARSAQSSGLSRCGGWDSNPHTLSDRAF